MLAPLPTPFPTPNAADPFGLAACLTDWCGLLRAAREIRDVDAEMMATLVEPDADRPAAPDFRTAGRSRPLPESRKRPL
ncbi:hypothetical protein ACFQE0_04220 [Methylobacterium komagatae]|uniref:Uncharacterized protein n=1 Tax=Methylobacterium komagatae TaxID=374425 RepID=A0ABW2BF33_9HYPH